MVILQGKTLTSAKSGQLSLRLPTFLGRVANFLCGKWPNFQERVANFPLELGDFPMGESLTSKEKVSHYLGRLDDDSVSFVKAWVVCLMTE